MIPILYEKNETSFTSNGLTRLVDCISCLVTEERNGIYEVEFQYPVSGKRFEDITIGRIIACTHDEQGDVQPFDIYAASEPINGIVTFKARHISYRLNEIPVKPFTAGSCSAAIAALGTNSVVANPFTFWTDKVVTADFDVAVPSSIRGLLGGEEGSILDVYGTGEFKFDKWDVKLYLHRGTDTDVAIRYGKNLVDFTNEVDSGDVYTAVYPYWFGSVSDDSGDEAVTTDTLVTLPEYYLSSGQSAPGGREIIVPLDLSNDFENPPTVAELRALATSKLNASDGWVPSQTMTVDFVQLWQTDEYKDYAPLQRLKLCDTCGVFVPMYGISVRAKVIGVVYNTLLDRYDKMELGDKPASYAAVLAKTYDDQIAEVVAGLQTIHADLDTVLTNAEAYTDDITDQIRGGTGGYIVTVLNGNGKPIELLITDNMDLNQAVNVWRWNLGGLAHSSNGYNGPYNDIALTQDGKINASMILTGALTANIITAGTITDASGRNYWNLDSGQFVTKQGTIGSFTISPTYLEYYSSASRWIRLDSYEVKTISVVNYASGNKSTKGVRLYNGNIYFVGKVDASYAADFNTQYLFELAESSAGYMYLSLSTYGGGSYIKIYPDNYNGPQIQMYAVDEIYVGGDFRVAGTKSRTVETNNYDERLLYCYETPTPLFGDVGESYIDEDGFCYVDIDDIFSETIAENVEYQVFLQKEGPGDCWISDKTPRYFVIQGTPGLRVAWELKAKQQSYQNYRLDQSNIDLDEYASENIEIDDYIAEQEGLLYG